MDCELNQLHYPFSEQARCSIVGFVLKEKKAFRLYGLGRDQLEHLASPMTKSETSPSANCSWGEWMYSALSTLNTTTEVPLSKAPNPQLL